MISRFVRGFWVSKRFDPGCFQVDQALDVVAERRHRHTKVGSRLPDRTNQSARVITAVTCSTQARTLAIR